MARKQPPLDPRIVRYQAKLEAAKDKAERATNRLIRTAAALGRHLRSIRQARRGIERVERELLDEQAGADVASTSAGGGHS